MKKFPHIKTIEGIGLGLFLLFCCFSLVTFINLMLTRYGNSPFIPVYGNKFVLIRGISESILSLAGIVGVLLIFKTIKWGWILAVTTCLSYLFVNLTFLLQSDVGFSIYRLILIILMFSLIISFLSKRQRNFYSINAITFVFPLLGATLFWLITFNALNLSIKLCLLGF